MALILTLFCTLFKLDGALERIPAVQETGSSIGQQHWAAGVDDGDVPNDWRTVIGFSQACWKGMPAQQCSKICESVRCSCCAARQGFTYYTSGVGTVQRAKH